MQRCSIVIPVYNRMAITRQCLRALFADPSLQRSAEVIVVDDGSQDLTPRLLSEYGDEIRTVRHSSNAGFATSCNDGAALASREYVLFLNNDTLPERGWLEALLTYADLHPDVSVVGSKLLFPNDTVQHAGVVICQDRIPRHLYAGFDRSHPAVNTSRSFQIVTAACMLVRRAAFNRVGGFDPVFRNGYEDVDFCLRLGQRGFTIHYCHQSELYHLESVSDQRFDHLDHNMRLYQERWMDQVVPDDLGYYVRDDLLRMNYEATYPARVTISPELAAVNGSAEMSSLGTLLQARSRQVYSLLKENIVQRVQDLENPSDELPRPGEVRRTDILDDEVEAALLPPQIVAEGRVQDLGKKNAQRFISILMPTKNGASQLREFLPRVFSQQIDARVELIAVDSGSQDETIDVLKEFGATIVAIDPRSYNHGSTRNLAARYARGDVFVFINQSTCPADEHWLVRLVGPLDADERLAGVCSRVLPKSDADLLNRKDGLRDPSGSVHRQVRQVDDVAQFRALPHHQQRLLINFHTVSAAIRPDVFTRIPFREVTSIGEDIQWAKDVLEAGHRIQHEPSSVVFHSHNYSYFDVLIRNVDDGLANREIVGRNLTDDEVIPTIWAIVADDWRYLEHEMELPRDELDRWRFVSALRRTSQIVGQWIGVNHDCLPRSMSEFLSLTRRIKAGNQPDGQSGVAVRR